MVRLLGMGRAWAVAQVRNVRIVNNTIVNHPIGVRIRWSSATDTIFGNNAAYGPQATALDAAGAVRHPPFDGGAYALDL